MDEKGKTVAIISYITFIGWIIALILYSNDTKKPSLARFHIKQSLGIFILGIAIWIAFAILIRIFIFSVPFLVAVIGFLSYLLWIGILVLIIVGIINAVNEQEKELPIIGKFANNKLTFIK